MTDIRNDHQLDEVIRQAEKTVDERVHGPGFVKVLDVKKGAVSDKPPAMARILGNKDLRYYFVKRHGKPVVISNWRFKWLEGTSEVELEFDGTFEIGVATEKDAERLVSVLGGYETPTLSLYQMIDAHLHKVLSKMYASKTQQESNILAIFGGTRGESNEINKEVSEGVAAELGSTAEPFVFRCGFKLISSPPVQVQFSQVPTSFEVSDSDVKCNINTSALLVLDNYQKYKASGLNDDESIKRYMKSALDEATQLYLFGKPYYTVVRNFSNTISKEIEDHLKKVAQGIGYQVRMFQSLTDIESMDLLDGMRVDVDAEETEFRTRNSTGHVKVGLSVEMKISDFDLLKRLIKPGQSGIKSILETEVIKICRDVITGIERRAFNLSFDKTVVPHITDALTEKLGTRYGLEVHVIKVEQEPTEDARRFQTLNGNTQYFKLEVKPLADVQGEAIEIESAFEIVGMSQNGWDAFENKDFGYRANSEVWTPRQRAALTKAIQEQIDNPRPEDIEHERRVEAIRNELDAIAQRIKKVIETKLDKTPQLAAAIRQAKHDADVKEAMELLAANAIRDEWGLEIKLREFKRLEGRSDITAQLEADRAHEFIRTQISADMTQRNEINEVISSGDRDYVEALMARRKSLLADEYREQDEVREELEDIDAKIAEKMPRADALLDLKTAKQMTAPPQVDKSWSIDNLLLEDSSNDASKKES